ncbi:hypothetical protein [Aquabacter cavernae]|uniref:hypothetical protein n=1 Tax=Aquabacter cavernae TaxID=2496029 RepID=UPI000F8F1DE5|nr:hypothetical protein [Aquabacter cavernae]
MSARMTSFTTFARATASASLAALGLVLAQPAFAQGGAPAPAATQTLPDALKALSDGDVSVSVALSDLGIEQPINLSGTDARRTLFLPVPAGVPIRDGVIALDARYLRGDGGRTSFVASVDGTPQSASSPTSARGDASVTLAVADAPRSSGFVQLGVAWASMVAEQLCFDDRSIGNVLEVLPTTRLTYSYDRNAVRDLATGWTALPPTTRVLLAPGALPDQSYDAAWRIGTVLERASKRVAFVTLPQVGAEVDLAGLEIPAALKGIPAFAALSSGGRHKIADAAELGALLMFAGRGPIGADIVISDDALRGALTAAADALRTQIAARGPEASSAFEAWRASSFTAEADPAGRNLRIAMLGGRSVIVVDAAAGAPAAGILSDTWRRTLQTAAVKVAVARPTVPGDVRSIPISRLGGVPGSFDVMVRGDWTATFDLGKAVSGGGLPSRLDLDLAAAPGAATSRPVASVFLNDYLLGARNMDANGSPEHLSVDIPFYALAPVNVLRVSFQRQPMGDRCRETPQAYPVAVLPSSRLVADTEATSTDFVGVIARLSGPVDLVVPPAYGRAPSKSLSRLVSLVAATGVSPEQARLVVAKDGAAHVPSANFLAFDVAVEGAKQKVRLDGERLVLTGRDDQPVLDVAGLDRLAVIQAVSAAGKVGLDYRTIGSGPASAAAFQLGTGDVAVIDAGGTVAQINTQSAVAAVADRPMDYLRKAWLERGMWGPIAVGVGILLFVLLLLRARAARRRNQSGH